MPPESIRIEMMTEGFLLWRCLHAGPLTPQTINDLSTCDETLPWDTFKERNLPLLEKLTRLYGSCAVIALDEEKVIGTLRFYPKEVCYARGAGWMCLQQEPPNGPVVDFSQSDFPAFSELKDKTLVVHCMMVGWPDLTPNPYQRKGIATRLVEKLIDWARKNGWEAIEATAYEDLNLIYAVTGTTGRRFWEKLGFQCANTGVELALLEESDFVKALMQDAETKGIHSHDVKNKYTMWLNLLDESQPNGSKLRIDRRTI